MPEWICGYCKHFRWTPPKFDDKGCFDDANDIDGECVGNFINIPVMWGDKGCGEWQENPNPDVIDDGYYLENRFKPKRINAGLYHYHGYEIKYIGLDKLIKSPIWEARSIRTGYVYCQYATLKEVIEDIDYHENH